MDEFGHVDYGEGSGLEIVRREEAGTHQFEESLRSDQQKVEHTWKHGSRKLRSLKSLILDNKNHVSQINAIQHSFLDKF